jgi:hypothetical protein
MKVASGQWRLLASALVTWGLLLGVCVVVRSEDKPVKKDDKPTPKSDEKTPKKTETPAPKKEAAEDDPPGFRFPDIDEALKKMPGLDAEQRKEMKKRMEEMREQMRKQFRAMRQRQAKAGFGFPPAFGPMGEMRLGAHLIPPSPILEDQFDLAKDQGLVVVGIGPNSPAAKAGLKKHDILVELNGKAVSSKPMEFAKQLKEIKPDTPVDAVVIRKGKKETIKGLKLPEAPAGGFPGFPGGQGGPKPPAFGDGAKGNTTVEANKDGFTMTHKEDGVKIVAKGKVEGGKPNVTEVVIESNGKSKTYDSLDKVPAEYKEKIQKLLGMGGAKDR